MFYTGGTSVHSGAELVVTSGGTPGNGLVTIQNGATAVIANGGTGGPGGT